MPMEIDRKQIKQQAREGMLLAKPSFWIVTIVYMLMTTGVSTIADFSAGTLGIFLTVAITLYSWVVGFSYRLWALWTARRLDPGLGSLVEGFSVAGRVIMLEISILTRTLGWTFMLSIPAGFLMVFNADANLLGYVMVIGLLSILVSIITLRYSMASYVLADFPDLGSAHALHQSVQLTRGWIMELVKLHLSFAGWYILSLVLSGVGMVIGALITGGVTFVSLLNSETITQLPSILGVGIPSLLGTLFSLPVTLYLTPYIEVTLAQFYDARIRLGEPAGDMPPL